MSPHKQIESALQSAVREILPDADVAHVLVRPCDPKFGDYQTNALMSLAKQRKLNPRQLAENVLAKLDVSEICEKVEIAGAGFLNFRLKTAALEKILQSAGRGEHLFFQKAAQPKSIVFDFSAPNVAKPMHVGHIRSTGIGDALQRTVRLLGHKVVSDNHIGDWGTQFGKLLLGWKQILNRAELERNAIAELERLYKVINAECDANPARLEEAKSELVKLQAGDAENTAVWKEMIALSQKQFDEVYSRLGVKFDVALGESFYNPWLGDVVNDLLAKKIARESEGAVAVFSEHVLPPKEDPFLVQVKKDDLQVWQDDPALVRKSDGAFNYMTTDLATIGYRLKTWAPDEIVYVVDDRQSAHFKKLFAVFARWKKEDAKKAKLVHVGFGKIMGDDGKPFKTRSGDTVKLGELLEEAEERAFKIVSEKSSELPEAQRKEIARVIGLGAVKYADLLPNRQSDYIFSWDKMLALQGNTAPYLQYAYARIRSIFRKAEGRVQNAEIKLAAAEELTLAKHLLNFGITLEAVAEEYRPNYLCNYLFELAGKFTSFYENCPVLKAQDEATKNSRLALCELTARVLKLGLETLGIEVVEQM